MGVILFLLAATVPVPPARALPVHLLDERRTSLVAEAGDRIVVRLPEAAGVPWRPGPPASAMLVVVGPAGGILRGRHREFAYQLRGAGRAKLAFLRPGTHRQMLRFTIESK